MIFHSDRGCQYTSAAFADLAADYQVVLSLGRTGQCPLTGQSRGLQFVLDWMVKGH